MKSFFVTLLVLLSSVFTQASGRGRCDQTWDNCLILNNSTQLVSGLLINKNGLDSFGDQTNGILWIAPDGKTVIYKPVIGYTNTYEIGTLTESVSDKTFTYSHFVLTGDFSIQVKNEDPYTTKTCEYTGYKVIQHFGTGYEVDQSQTELGSFGVESAVQSWEPGECKPVHHK